jgi:hypothetical protein
MNSRATVVVILAVASSCGFGQLTIENPRHVPVPEDQARILLRMSVQAVAKELRVTEKTNVQFALRLVIGQEDEHFGLDEKTGVPTLFLRQWDPVKFTTAAVRFAIQESVGPERKEQMISEIVRRSERVAPVSAAQLRGIVGPATQPVSPEDNCLKGISDSSVREPLCCIAPENRSKAAQ